MSNNPQFLIGYFYVVGFKSAATSQVVFSPRADLTRTEVLQSAAELVQRNFGDQIVAGDVARIHGPFPAASGTVVSVTQQDLDG